MLQKGTPTEMRNGKNYKKTIIVLLTIVLCISLPIIYYNITNEPIKSLLFGIISSIVASVIFHLFSEVVFDNKHKEIEELKSITKTLGELQTKGILSIRGRNEFEQDFWISLLLETNDKLILSGRTLNRWLEGSMQVQFEKNLKRILQNNGEVSLIIYKDLQGSTEVQEKKALHDFLKNKIFPLCIQKSVKKGRYIKKKKVKLNIVEVDILPYLYTANENRIIVAPYFKYVENSNNIMFNLKRDGKYGSEYVRDFEKIIANGQPNAWLSEYLKEKNKGEKNELSHTESTSTEGQDGEHI